MDRLKELGLYDDTLIVLWGDHGYHLGERELWCKSTVYEAACRAPLVIKPAGQPRHREVEEVVEFLDVYPTLLDLCGIEDRYGVSGRSLRPLLDGRSVRKRYAVSQFQRPYPALTSLKKRRYMGYAVRDQRWTYTEWVDLKGYVVECELYDMSPGGLERRNLAGEPRFGSVELRMSRALHRVLRNQKGVTGIAAGNFRKRE